MLIYKRDGKWGKLKGFEYYLRSENKLRPNQREDFLIKSEGYIGMINEISTTQYPYMDSSMSDIELMEMWNDIYHQWGWVIAEFRDRWIKEKLNSGNADGVNHSNEWWEFENENDEKETR
jgi:hypothetical protein